MTTAMVQSAESRVVETLTQNFWLSGDGYWYPLATGTALVRVQVADGAYKIERRRTHRDPWMRLAEALAAEFDPESLPDLGADLEARRLVANRLA